MIMFIFLCLSGSQTFAQKQTGSIKGHIVDLQGNPLEKVIIYLDSPVLMAISFYITPPSGRINFDLLPPGNYSIRTEIPGYTSTTVENLTVRLGQTLKIKMVLKKSEIEDEETQIIHSPVLDPQSTKTAVTISSTMLKTLPLQRDLFTAVLTAPGALHESSVYPKNQIFLGSTARSNLYTVDGLSLNDPAQRHLITRIPYDIIDEIEVETAGHSAATGMADGGYVNILTRSGKKGFRYSFLVEHTSGEFIKKLRPLGEISQLGTQSPEIDKQLWDFNMTLGGVLWPDRAWFFSSLNWFNNTRTTPFTPWVDTYKKAHKAYDWKNDEKSSFVKLTLQPYSKFKAGVTFYFKDHKQTNTAQSLAWNLTRDATYILDHEQNFFLGGSLQYLADQNTSLLVTGGYIEGHTPLYLQESHSSSLEYYDDLLGYHWGSAQYNDRYEKKKLHVQALITHYLNRSTGFDAVINAGLEYQYLYGKRNVWKENGMLVHYFNGSPYFYGLQTSPVSDMTVGAGKISMNFASSSKDGFTPSSEVRNIGIFLSNSMTFADRITLNLGLRFDRSIGNQSAYQKFAIGNAVGLKIGEELISPIVGQNPYSNMFIPIWKNLIVWNSFSPRAGLVIDLFGNSKTLLKGSFARYTEIPSLQLLDSLNPIVIERTHDYYWYDEDMNGEVGTEDTFTLFPDDYRIYSETAYGNRLAGDLSTPYTNELTISLQQEILKDFSLKVTLIRKDKKNIINNVLMDQDSGQYWYTNKLDTQNWWVPFETIVPAAGEYPETPVTVYFPSNSSPLYFDQIKNVPELKRTFRAVEFVLNKRMSNNWMLNGSLVLSESKGNIHLGYSASSGMTQAAYNPNYFVNFGENTRLDYDRPLAVKVMGTFQFPWDLMLSVYYRHLSGALWARSVTIAPPADWTETRNTRPEYMQVLLEEPGSRRLKASNILDLRFEKTFSISERGRLSFFVDVLNAFGDKYSVTLENVGGYWFPAAESTTLGTRVLSSYFNKVVALGGTKTFRISMRIGF